MEKRKRVLITTSFPSAEQVRKELGVSKRSTKKIQKMMDDIAAKDKTGKVTFYDPHSGRTGTPIRGRPVMPIPPAVKKVADKLNGRTLSLREAMKRLRKVTKGKLEVMADCIVLEIKEGKNIRHGFRVICFR